MEFIRKVDLGYSRDQILIIHNTDQLGARSESLKTNLLQLSGVEKATLTGFLPVSYFRSNDSFFTTPTLDAHDAISMQAWTIDENYLSTMDMKILDGRNFSKNIAADTTGIILNEAAAKFLGNTDILDKKLYRISNTQTGEFIELKVIGIVRDFNFSSLREQVKPLAFVYGNNNVSMSLKISTADVTSLVSSVEKQWDLVAPDLPFEYSFMDDSFNKLYVGEQQVGKLFTIFASLSIFISCLGLFGLSTFIAEQRTKEIGIRKVLGASVSGITTLLSKDFLTLVLISIVVASPITYYLMTEWLSGFAFRVGMNGWVLVISGIIAVVIAFATVSFQAIRAAMSNPVKSLRSE
jgi:putative ABC transport system permease protein